MTSTRPLALALLLTLPVSSSLGCDAPPPNQAAKAPAKPPPVPAPAPEVAPPAEATPPAEPPPPVEPPPPAEPTPPVEATPPVEEAPPPEPTPTITNIRDPALLPASTPAANKTAFSRLPVAKADGPPVGGAGANGIHLDVLEIGRGWHKSRCDQLGNAFTVGEDERVNVCMRIIHPRDVEEELIIKWNRDGKLSQRSKVTVKGIHAYLTRGWLPITESRKGAWSATIESSDGAVLGELSFTIE